MAQLRQQVLQDRNLQQVRKKHRNDVGLKRLVAHCRYRPGDR